MVKTAVALYDYEKQTEEELSFKESQQFNIYDLSDPDWVLVGNSAGTEFGFIPSNYIEIGGLAAAPAVSPAVMAPPPQHPSLRQPSPPDEPVERAMEERVDPVEEDLPPPMPTRPSAVESEEEAPPTPARPLQATTTGNRVGDYEQEEEVGSQEHNFDGEFFTWFIDEVDGRKKRAVKFSIGQGLIKIAPNTSNPKKLKLKSASSLDHEWTISDLIEFSLEKKHVFLDFKNPQASIELHAGSKDVAEAIVSILGDLKGAERAKGLKEVERASRAKASASNKKIGRLLFDFESQGSDELAAKEGDEVFIINDTKSLDWWMCENTTTGKQGVVPSSYIEIIGTETLDKLTDGPQRRRSQKPVKGRIVNGSKAKQRSRDERDRIRERDREQREKHKEKREPGDKLMPNYHRVRTWIDSSGSFKVEAEFLGCVEGKIHLHKTNGVKIAVAATKLSLEDLEYVEKVTGTSLEDYKDEVQRQNQKRARTASKPALKEDVSPIKEQHTRSAMAAINDIPPPQPTRPKTTTQVSAPSEPDYDWFEFFLQCGVDVGNCQRYTLNFNREQMDENILEDINPSLLRTLGLREGDILRVMKFLDNKFNRKKTEEPAAPGGGLFLETTGALKNNSSSTEISKVNASALPSPQKAETQKYEDDAWAVKPAARSSEDLSKGLAPQTPQYTGSLQDLVNIKPLETEQKPAVPEKDKPVQASKSVPSAPALTPVKTGPLVQPGDQFTVQKTGNSNFKPVPPQQTGGLIPVQPTGFIPIPAQPTGFMPIQPTGFVSVQPTGLQPQLTFGIVPLQPGVATFKGVPATTFGQPVLQTGSVTLPQTTFGQQVTGGPIQQVTGGFPQTSFGQVTGGFPQQITGGIPQTSFGQASGLPSFGQPTGGFPQTSFGQANLQGLSLQKTGPLVPLQPTGGFVPQSAFGQQITGGQPYQSNVNQVTNMFQNTSISQQQQPQQTFQSQPFQQPFNQANTFGQFPQTSFGQQASFGQPQTSFGQPQATFGQPQASHAFGQPPTSFGGFDQQPLQSQPTGLGFGNAPGSLQLQPTGRANLQAATPDNPFGF